MPGTPTIDGTLRRRPFPKGGLEAGSVRSKWQGGYTQVAAVSASERGLAGVFVGRSQGLITAALLATLAGPLCPPAAAEPVRVDLLSLVAHDLAATGVTDEPPVLFVPALPTAEASPADDAAAPAPLRANDVGPFGGALDAAGRVEPPSLQAEWLSAVRAMPDEAAAEAPLGTAMAAGPGVPLAVTRAQDALDGGLGLVMATTPTTAASPAVITGPSRWQRGVIEWLVAPLVVLALLAALWSGHRRSGRRRPRRAWTA